MIYCSLCGDPLDVWEEIICSSCIKTFVNTEFDEESEDEE